MLLLFGSWSAFSSLGLKNGKRAQLMLNSKLVLDPLKRAHTTTVSVMPSPWLLRGAHVPSLWFRSKQTHPRVESQQSLSGNNEDCIRIILPLILSCPSDKLNLKSLSCSLGCTYNSRDSLPSAHIFL